jgi:phenylpropionate dioxygenase-like ring-hydroxylating dioxygenase large terminal subunit
MKRSVRLTGEPALRRYWYPVAQVGDVAGAPVARRLLGVDIVLWRTADGAATLHGAVDRCPHRDARLSVGWVDGCALVCPYHGWEYGPEGKATRIPQLDAGTPIPPQARLETVQVAERYGWVWACLSTDPALALPEIPEYDDPAWRAIHEPDSDWACPAVLLLENNIDPAHIAFVHRGSFGTPVRPEVPVAEVDRQAHGLRTRYVVPVESRPGEEGATVRTTTTQVHGPLLALIRITYPDGLVHLMIKACTPVDDRVTRQLQTVVRNDGEADRPAADVIAFDDQVWTEDKAVLETAHHDWFLDLTANVHIKVDRPSIEYRRFMSDVVEGAFP